MRAQVRDLRPAYCSTLQRIARADGDVDPTNWLGTFGMLQVTDLSLTSENVIRLDGVDSSGGSAVVYVDSSSGTLTTTTTDLQRLHQVLPLQQ